MQLSASRDERHTHSAVPAAPLQTPAKAERRAKNGPLGKQWGKQGTGYSARMGRGCPEPRENAWAGFPTGSYPGWPTPPPVKCRYFLLVKAEVFQADDEGSIPFTRSIFKIKHLYRNIEEAECA